MCDVMMLKHLDVDLVLQILIKMDSYEVFEILLFSGRVK